MKRGALGPSIPDPPAPRACGHQGRQETSLRRQQAGQREMGWGPWVLGTTLTSLACLIARMAVCPSCRRNRGQRLARRGPGHTRSQPRWPHPCFQALAAFSLSHKDTPGHSLPPAAPGSVAAPPSRGLMEGEPQLTFLARALQGRSGQNEGAQAQPCSRARRLTCGSAVGPAMRPGRGGAGAGGPVGGWCESR